MCIFTHDTTAVAATRFRTAWLRNFTTVPTIFRTVPFDVCVFFHEVYGFVVANLAREFFAETSTMPAKKSREKHGTPDVKYGQSTF